MRRVTILSPHLDDAVFSLTHTIDRWCSLSVDLTVVNFFTRSEYGPRIVLRGMGQKADRPQVSVTRMREDRRALRTIGPQIRIEDYSLLDGPVRRRTSLQAMFDLNSVAIAASEVASLRFLIEKYIRKSLVLAPLGLGGHLDHLTVKAAALLAAKDKKLGFYDDAPYVRWAGAEEISQRVSDTGISLVSRFVSAARPHRFKERTVASYQTQIDRAEAQKIARFSIGRRSGERIWIPRHSKLWLELLTVVRGW